MEIRTYQKTDQAALIELMQAHVPTYFAASEVNDYLDYLDELREDYFVIELDQKVVAGGGINYFPEQRTARISWDVVSHQHTGQGLGKRLVAHRIAHIRSQDLADKVVVRTSQFAYDFYAKQGFTLLTTTPDFWAPGYDLYEMEMKM